MNMFPGFLSLDGDSWMRVLTSQCLCSVSGGGWVEVSRCVEGFELDQEGGFFSTGNPLFT